MKFVLLLISLILIDTSQTHGFLLNRKNKYYISSLHIFVYLFKIKTHQVRNCDKNKLKILRENKGSSDAGENNKCIIVRVRTM